MNRHGIIAALALVVTGACSMEVEDLNNLSASDLENSPTRPMVQAAATGLLVGHRARVAIDNGYVAILGVLGREALIFAASDPGFVVELLQENPGLDPGSTISGANFWVRRYANIRGAFSLMRAVDRVAGFSDEEREAIRGFAKTISALDFLVLINTRDQNGAAIDVDRPYDAELAPIACKEEVMEHIATLLDAAHGHLEAGGAAFPFPLSTGFEGFNTPSSFARLNRAIKARVEVYRGNATAALAALEDSFISTDASDPQLDVGAFHVFGGGPGEPTNELISATIYAHPSIVADAEAGDQRLSAVRVLPERSDAPSEKPGSYSYQDPEEEFGSNLRFTLYPSNDTPVPIIRNEELILLRAEANIALGNGAEALADLNFIREHAAGLPVLSGTDDPGLHEGTLLGELLHQRRYSLLFEGGHRWIDMRRHGRLSDLPVDSERHVVHEKFPIPLSEANARSNQVECSP